MLMAQLCFSIFVPFHLRLICLEAVRLQLQFKSCCIFQALFLSSPTLTWPSWLSTKAAGRNSTGEDESELLSHEKFIWSGSLGSFKKQRKLLGKVSRLMLSVYTAFYHPPLDYLALSCSTCRQLTSTDTKFFKKTHLHVLLAISTAFLKTQPKRKCFCLQ